MRLTVIGFGICMLVSFSGLALGNKTYNCVQEKQATIAVNTDGTLRTDTKESMDKPVSISFVISQDGATLSVPGDAPAKLKKLNETNFSQVGKRGMVYLWTLFPGKNGESTFIYQNTAFEVANALGIIVAYRCK